MFVKIVKNKQKGDKKSMNYNEALRRAREHRELEQKNLAEILNTTQQQISLYETGQRELKTSQIIKICKALNLSADYILGLTDKPQILTKK